jgi:zinc protease
MKPSTAYCLNDVVRYRLDNGLTVLTREDHSVPIVSSMIWYRAGSRLEVEGKTGVSHLLEHMMFKGTGRYRKGEIDYITTRHGGSNNAFTSRDYTAYYFSFASDRWYQALEIEADRMRNAVFDPEELELERHVVLEELRMDQDSPWGNLRQAVELKSFLHHPYRNPVIGSVDDVSALSPDDLAEYYETYYVPNNAILVVVGDFETRDALRRIEQEFSPVASRPLPLREVAPEHPCPQAVRFEIEKPTHVARFLWAFPAPSVRHPDHYGLDLLDKVLSQGKLARLHRRLVERERSASAVSSEFDDTYEPFLFFIRAELQPGAEPRAVEEAVAQEISQLHEELISESEFERARNQCLAQFLADFETSLDQSVQIGLLETLDRFEYWNDYAAKVRGLTRETLREVARKYLDPGQGTLGILVNGIKA